MADSNRTRPPRALWSQLAWFALAALVAGLAAWIVGDYASERELVARRARLQLVWPDLAAFPSRDRDLLNALAVHCQLAREPLSAIASVSCLRRAASDAAFSAPAGIDAPAELRRLLTDRPGAAPAWPAPAPLA